MDKAAIAVFSDVHSNLEALEAVLADMETLELRRCFCLGDTVGYAADPAACLERVRSLGCPVLQGNHDAAAATDAELDEMNLSAQAGMEFSRRELSAQQRAWLGTLPLQLAEDGWEFVHGSLDAPAQWWYVLSPEDAILHFEAQTRPLCFCGHTHAPMVWHWSDAGRLTLWRGEGRISLPGGGKTLINVGSVGQPRDRNPDACYAVFEPRKHWIEFRRVPYDMEETQRKILQAGLPRFTAGRLSAGR